MGKKKNWQILCALEIFVHIIKRKKLANRLLGQWRQQIRTSPTESQLRKAEDPDDSPGGRVGKGEREGFAETGKVIVTEEKDKFLCMSKKRS